MLICRSAKGYMVREGWESLIKSNHKHWCLLGEFFTNYSVRDRADCRKFGDGTSRRSNTIVSKPGRRKFFRFAKYLCNFIHWYVVIPATIRIARCTVLQTWGNRNRQSQSITVFWVIVIDWIEQKLNVIVIDYLANLIVIDDYFRD